MFDAAVCTLLSYLSFLLHFLKIFILLLVLDNSVMNVITTTGLGHCFRSFGGSNGFADLAVVHMIVVRADLNASDNLGKNSVFLSIQELFCQMMVDKNFNSHLSH